MKTIGESRKEKEVEEEKEGQLVNGAFNEKNKI